MEHQAVRLGSTIGAVLGTVFVLVNAGPLPAALLWRGLGVLALVAVLVLAARSRVEAPPPGRGALRVYGLSVGAMVIAIPGGARALTALDRPELVLPWVVLVVGAHFSPFARTFGAPVFLVLSLVMVLLGLAGGAAELAGVEEGGEAAAVLAGFSLLGAAAAGLVRPAGNPVGRPAPRS